ncbi:hypothetical protein DQ04_12631000 [Trypanosoma grayi]|uniref:hypothetical protein n=1 Tax=Trypanosoma grayi TaxID=71804 RepID=UPI0004F4B24C|nr:hypothetical protein DQ04_12631000 [Trypanosoma grayi]KEG06709.1 hypothetical protein DQ04_12631000 [Trypanosoma grayi]
MVLLSIRRMDIMTEQGIQALHLQGLERMQYAAAKKAQREEILRQRRIEQQGVEGIPVGRLLEHLKESPAMYARGTQLLDSESGLAVMLRAGFFSLLDAYDTVAEETEVRVREVQALIARALAQLPSSMMDSALDAVCVRLRRDLQQYRNSSSSSNNNDNNARDKAAPSPPPITSAYHLTMQVLFTLFSAQAPVRERGANAFAFMSAITAAPEEEDGASLQLHSHATFTIDTDNPVEWLQSTHDSVGAFGDRKRPREAEAGVHNDGDKNGETSADGASRFFRDDSVQTPCVYSHLLCRVMELLTEAEQPALLLDALLQCPRLTRYVWHYIHKHYCLSAEKARCLLGMWLLKNLAVKRVVYRRYAVNSLLHLAAAWSEYPRRLAVTQLGALLAAGGPDGRRVIDKSAESLLVRYAKRQMAAIPLAKLPSPSSGGGSVVVDVTAAKSEDNTDVATLREREMRKLADALDRHLGPFLMLCARQPKELFPALFSVFKECVERQNEAMIHLLAEHVDVRRMCQRLFRVGTLAFMSNVMPFLRRHSGDATLLVQKILWAISAELRLMGPGTDAAATDLEQTAVALLGHARVMFDGSAIPLLYRAVSSAGATVDDTASLHDVRFIAPFMSLVTAEELRRVYLRAFLHFVQMQLQQQQQAATAAVGANAAGGVAHMRGEELHQFIQDVVREVLVRSSVRISDGASRGLSRVDLLIYLHRAPHESVATDAHAAHSQAASASSGVARAESRGILGDANPSSSPSPAAAAAATAAVAAKSQTAEDLPISTLTTKEVIGVLLRLSRTFDDATAELLYGPEEIKSAVRQLMQHSGGAPVPSQLMATLILACGIHAQRPHTDLVRFVHQEVLLPLAKDATWEKDMQLWRGVLFFAEAYYRECSSFLINLPDQVLIDALRARTQLCDYFKEEHGNNASFGHVLGSL